MTRHDHIVRLIKSRRMELAGHAAYLGDMGSTYKILIGNRERKRPL
jgi:hypothetical protein